jgi:hypothetical protein
MSESTTMWLKSSYCSDSACVEIAKLGSLIALRDSKDLGQAPLTFSRAAWTSFLSGIEAGNFGSQAG